MFLFLKPLPLRSPTGAPPSMDTISGLINLQNQSTLPTSPPTPPPSTSKTATQQPPHVTTTTLTADIPFSTSINQLHTFSTALSAFLNYYDDLQTHINFINSSIDSKLPPHLVETVSPNLSALTNVRLLEIDCDRTITALPEVSLSERNPKNVEEIDVLKKHAETDALKKPVAETFVDQAINDVLEAIVSEQNPKESESDCEPNHESATADFSRNIEEFDASKKLEVVDVSKNCDEIDVLKKHVETDALKKPVAETFVDQAINDVLEAIVSEQNPKESESDCQRNHESATADFSPNFEEFDASKKLEVVVDVSKNCGEMDASENFVEIDSLKKCEEIDVLKKHVETFGGQSVTAFPEAVVLEQKPNGTATSGERSNEINVRTPEGLEETYIGKDPQGIDVLQKPEENYSSRSPEETYTLKKQRKRRKTGKKDKDKDKDKDKETTLNKFAGKLQFLCKNMVTKGMRWHVAKHLSETLNLREEIIKALKLAKDPAKLVLNCTGNFFGQDSRSFCKDLGNKETAGRLASVLMLECFVMISNDDGIEIEKRERERALSNAVIWRKRMIREGGFGHTDEVDARGLLLLISGFGIQDDVFKIQDIVDLIRASNVKGISTALRRSAFLMPKIPDVISLMVKNNLEIEAVDIAYTFGLEDTCNSQNILTTYLHNKIKDIQNDSPFQTLEAMKQQLLDLKSVKQCLESHKVDPSTLLPDFKINEKIQILEKEVNESKLIQKRKSLENPIHQEAKRACFGHENMPHHHEPVDNYVMVLEQIPSESASDCEWSHESATMPDSTDFSQNYEKIDTLKNLEVVDVSKNSEEIDVSENPVEIDTTKTLEEFDVLKKHEELDTLMKHAETDTLKKQEKIVTETFGDQTIGVVSGRNPNGIATNGEQSREIVTAPESLEEINVSNKPEEIDVLKKPEELDTSMIPEETVPETSVVSVLQSFCESMSPRQLRQHVATHFSKMINLREEIAKSLKLAKDPVYLVRSSIGSFFVSRSTTFRNYNHKLSRMVAVLILECFVMISSDGIEIANSDREYAAKDAVIWRKRMIREGGFGKTDVVDARGLLLLISGFGIQDHVFKIQDIMDLIRASNWKGISAALRRSAFLMPKIPDVISLMVKNNLETEAVDMAYTFGLEDMCNPRNILTTYLNNKIKDIQNDSPFQKLEAMKSVKQCLESHNVDPSKLLPDFKINEEIQNLEKEVSESKLIQKRKSLENSIHQEAKRACFGHENTSINPEENCTCEEIDSSKKRSETDSSKNPVPETSYDETITAVPEAIVSEQNPNRMASYHEQSDENVRTPESLDETDVLKKPEQTDICKNTEVTVVLKKPQEPDTPMVPEEMDTSKKPEETVPETSCDQTTPAVPEPIVTEQNPNRTAANRKQIHENVTEKSAISELESLCESMSSKELKWHVAANLSEMINLRKELAKTLKLAKDPAKLVLNSIGAFFVQDRKTFLQKKQDLGRKAAVLILEWFGMISGDGIEIAKSDKEFAAKAAVEWRNRMIKEGGFGKTDEVDARGLLLLISGFGIQDHVFEIRDIVDLIRASNVKEISTALRRSIFLVPKIPEVIDLMVKNNLEIEAADIAFTFGLEDKCRPLSILATFLRNRLRNSSSSSFFHMFQLEEMKQQLFDLKSVKQCLESHNIDPSVPFPDFQINEKIQNLEKELNKEKPIQKRKSLDGPIYQEAKRACSGHENMPHRQSPVDHYGMNRYHQSTQLSTSYFDPCRDLHNSYISNYTPSSVYNSPAMHETIPSPVPNGPAVGSFIGSNGHIHHSANVKPYGRHEPYVQHYSRHGQTYDSQPYGRGRPWEWGPPEPFPPTSNPLGGFPRRRGPTLDLYSDADKIAMKYLR
ncbi:hypothetical protein HanIR_Chr05g0248801 [Helianthus annuus]|nr:hypothetical protein HanIR_Chr05g0248801 [Helianthus annuus]